jgi:hypothetical protein
MSRGDIPLFTAGFFRVTMHLAEIIEFEVMREVQERVESGNTILVFQERLEIVDAAAKMSERPGFGLSWNEDRIRHSLVGEQTFRPSRVWLSFGASRVGEGIKRRRPGDEPRHLFFALRILGKSSLFFNPVLHLFSGVMSQGQRDATLQ